MAYSKTEQLDATSVVYYPQYNNLRAELKAAAEGLQLADDVDPTLAFVGGPGADQLSSITFIDNQADTNLDIDAVATMSYDANGFPTQVVSAFSKLGVNLTSVFTISNGRLTGIARTLS